MTYIVPVLNEERYIAEAVRTILAQDYPGEKELILALGPSTDRTNAVVAELQREDSRIITVANPQVDIPIGLNLAIAAGSHPILVRVDAHAKLSADYTKTAIATLLERNAGSVGGIMHAQGERPFQQAVARAYNSPFGLGGGSYHGHGEEGPAESAYLGIFRREVVEAVGLFDERLRRGEDWELNQRILAAGYTVWFNPALKVTYYPRETPTQLAKQFLATGTWRAELVKRTGGKHPWRFFAPPLLLLACVCTILFGMLSVLPGVGNILGILALVSATGPMLYLISLVLVSARLPAPLSVRDRLYTLLAFVIMHLSWGCGFLIGLLVGAAHSVDRSRVTGTPHR